MSERAKTGETKNTDLKLLHIRALLLRVGSPLFPNPLHLLSSFQGTSFTGIKENSGAASLSPFSFLNSLLGNEMHVLACKSIPSDGFEPTGSQIIHEKSLAKKFDKTLIKIKSFTKKFDNEKKKFFSPRNKVHFSKTIRNDSI
jgi:hypothetical protein